MSHRGWKVPFQKYLWCSGDWVMVRRNAIDADWEVVMVWYLCLPVDESYIVLFPLYPVVVIPMYTHKAKRDFPQHKRLHPKLLVCNKKCPQLLKYLSSFTKNKKLVVRTLITKATLTVAQGTYWVLVDDGTSWRNPVQATEMWRVTLKVTSRPIRWHTTHFQTHARTQLELLLGGISGHKLAVNHTLSFLTTKHANTFSHTVSHHFGSTSPSNEWLLCFTDKLTHFWRRWGNSGCFKMCTTCHAGRPESTPCCFFKKHFRLNLVYHVLETNFSIKSKLIPARAVHSYAERVKPTAVKSF